MSGFKQIPPALCRAQMGLEPLTEAREASRPVVLPSGEVVTFREWCSLEALRLRLAGYDCEIMQVSSGVLYLARSPW